jgi:hypothetical protein
MEVVYLSETSAPNYSLHGVTTQNNGISLFTSVSTSDHFTLILLSFQHMEQVNTLSLECKSSYDF